MRKLLRSNYVTVGFLFLAAVGVSAIVYPEVFISFKTSFALWNDYCIEYPLTFVLTNFFYQGGIQLWNHYGQLPFFHTYVAYGLFKFPNVLTAIVYCLMAPFCEDSSRLFHQVFTWVNLMTLLLIRLVGIFLLLRTVTKEILVLTLGTVISAVFLGQWGFSRGEFYMSYFPLGMYFIVRFFQEIQWRYFAAMFLFFIISLGNGIHYGAYMYLPMHFFIISGILWRLFFNPASRVFVNTFRPVISPGMKVRWQDIGWVIALAGLIMAPYAYIVKFGFSDLAFGQADSRITHPFSPQWYFHNPDVNLGDPSSFISSILNFQMGIDAFYLGIVFLFLAIAGLVLSKHPLKWFFGIGVFFLWLLSFPREGMNLGFVAHWINALTNPLKTIPRSFPYTCQSMLFYLLLPLVVMGIEIVRELYQGNKYSKTQLLTLGAMVLLVVWLSVPTLPSESRTYLIVCSLLIMGGIVFMHIRSTAVTRALFLGIMCFLMLSDLFLVIYQSKWKIAQSERKSTILDAAPQAGMLAYDFENPSIFPYRYTYALNFSYRDEIYMWFPHGVSSDLHHVVNQALNYAYLNGHNPRHIQFVKWLDDPSMWSYLSQNNEFIFLAQAAVNDSPEALNRICAAGLARQVITVADSLHSLNLPDQWPHDISSKVQDIQYDQVSATLDDLTDYSEYHPQGDMMIFTWHLPSNFPDHLASSWFLEEQRYLRFLIQAEGQQWHELQATQGELIRPYTFDVQNIKKGELKAAFPKNDFPLHQKCVLLYPSTNNQGVQGLWRSQFDNLGITFKAKKDGWWVGHYPYDKKWRITVDGNSVAYYRVNKSFIGFPLVHGEHKILIQYWPDSPLRILLLVSAILTTLGLPMLMFFALRWEPKL